MTDPTFAGDPGGMIRAGWGVRGVADVLDGDVSSRQVRLTVPAGTNAAWAVGSVATAVTTDWQTYLVALARKVEALGINTIAAGTGYQAADREAAREMRWV